MLQPGDNLRQQRLPTREWWIHRLHVQFLRQSSRWLRNEGCDRFAGLFGLRPCRRAGESRVLHAEAAQGLLPVLQVVHVALCAHPRRGDGRRPGVLGVLPQSGARRSAHPRFVRLCGRSGNRRSGRSSNAVALAMIDDRVATRGHNVHTVGAGQWQGVNLDATVERRQQAR